MLQVTTSRRLEDVGAAICAAAQHHGAAVLAITHLGQLIGPRQRDASHDALVYTICQAELYGALLAADVRFAAFLPCRIAAILSPSGLTLETLSPREFCQIIHRSDLERLAAPLETLLRDLMEEAAEPARYAVTAATHAAGSDPGATEMQMNPRAPIPQRIDCRGTKVEDIAGTGVLDAPGG